MCLTSSSVWWGVSSVITSNTNTLDRFPAVWVSLILHSMLYGVNHILHWLCISVCDNLASMFNCISTHKLYFAAYVHKLGVCVCLMHHSDDVSHLALPWSLICSGKCCVCVCVCVCIPSDICMSVCQNGGSLLWCFYSDNDERWNKGIWYKG